MGLPSNPNVSNDIQLGENVIVDPSAVVGLVGRAGLAPVRIGANSVIRSHTTIYSGVTAGDGLQTGHGTLIRENNILGSFVSVGSGTALEPGNRIGDRTRIHSGCFLENVTLGEDVFIGPNVVFTDDPHPPCEKCTDFVGGATVEDGAAIGGNATILPGVRIGARALVGAGSVVTHDVEAGVVVVGNPARPVKRREDLVCRALEENRT